MGCYNVILYYPQAQLWNLLTQEKIESNPLNIVLENSASLLYRFHELFRIDISETRKLIALALFSLSDHHPPSAIRKSIISNLIIALATTPKLKPLPSNLQPQLKLILPSSAKPQLQLCWLAELALVSDNPAPPHHPGKFIW